MVVVCFSPLQLSSHCLRLWFLPSLLHLLPWLLTSFFAHGILSPKMESDIQFMQAALEEAPPRQLSSCGYHALRHHRALLHVRWRNNPGPRSTPRLRRRRPQGRRSSFLFRNPLPPQPQPPGGNHLRHPRRRIRRHPPILLRRTSLARTRLRLEGVVWRRPSGHHLHCGPASTHALSIEHHRPNGLPLVRVLCYD